MARPALLLLTATLVIPAVLNAQQVSTAATAARDAQSVTLLQRSLASLIGTSAVKDLTLNGNATWIAGSDNETGTATLKATAIGQGRIDLSLTAGQRSEVRDVSVIPLTGSWSGSDAVWHSIANHNLMTDSSWFFPTFLIGRVLSNAGYQISPADAETLDGAAVQHVTLCQQYIGAQQLPALLQGLSQIEIYLNPSNSLPVAVAFNIHPDNDAGMNIPVRIQYSSYQTTQGVQLPYHVQKYVNNGLILDLAIQSVQINTGLTSFDFQVQ